VQIYIKNDWLITISENGGISINSMTDAHPSSMAHTRDNVVKHKDIVEALTNGTSTAKRDREKRIKLAWAILPENKKKYPVSENLLFKILSKSSGKWEFPGLTDRFVELLAHKPILEDEEKQINALRSTNEQTGSENPEE
jgi:hypothetical protein